MKDKVFRHILFWTVYLIFDTYTEYFWMFVNNSQLERYDVFIISLKTQTAVLLLVKMPLVYSGFYLLKKYALTNSKKIYLVLSFIGIILIFNVVMQVLYFKFLIPLLFDRLEVLRYFNYQFLLTSLFDEILILGIAIALKQYYISQNLRENQQLLEKEKLETELNFLKAQINPHFLFNTLNNIYSLARKKSDETPELILKLSKLFRFVLYETQSKKITISQEVQFLNDYIELEKVRYKDRLSVLFEYQIDNENTLIAPLILIPIVENAFKHGGSEAISKGFIKIFLKLNNNKLFFDVKNSFEKETINENQSGIGLKNLKRQLELMYPTFDLIIKNEETIFNAKLIINLN